MADDDDPKATPSAKAAYAGEGYNQTYVILSNERDIESKLSDGNHQVFFRCGNWCYRGQIQFNGLKMDTSNLPVLIPMLQRQQNSLRYYCSSNSIPKESEYYDAIELLSNASKFVAEEVTSEHVEKELRKWSSVFPWIDDDAASCYFELVMEIPPFMNNVALVASKTYDRGLILISLYFERTLYFIVQQGEGDQPLLDVRFPDVSRHGQGLHIASYKDNEVKWRKLTLWHIMSISAPDTTLAAYTRPKTVNLSTKNYLQTYCVLKGMQPDNTSGIRAISYDHDVLFRFGSWCYAGRVQLTPVLSLADIPFVIPALRLQQSKMEYLCDVSNIPCSSPFAAAMEYMMKLAPLIEEQISQSESCLTSLIDRLSKMGLGESVSRWLDGEAGNSFFEFRVTPDNDLERIFANIEIVASKCYHASGVVTVTVVFQHHVYVTVLDGSNENPLLDSRFPDVSGKGRGYQLQSYPEGIDDWSTLRKVSIWQTVSALEQEFRERTRRLAQSKRILTDEYSDSPGTSHSHSLRDREEQAIQSDEEEEDDGDDDGDREGKRREDDKAVAAATVSISLTTVSNESGSGGSMAVAESKTTAHSHSHSHSRLNGGDTSTSSSSSKSSRPSEEGGSLDSKRLDSKGQLLDKAELTSSTTSPSAAGAVEDRPLNPLLVTRAPRPRNLPKMESLSKKVEEMRRTMDTAGGDGEAPWDSRGRPLNGASSLLKK